MSIYARIAQIKIDHHELLVNFIGLVYPEYFTESVCNHRQPMGDPHKMWKHQGCDVIMRIDIVVLHILRIF